MTAASTAASSATSTAAAGNTPSAVLRQAGYAATLLPAGLVALCAVPAGRSEAARARWLRAGELPPGARSPGSAAVLWNALLTSLLGCLALMVVGLECLFVLRGLLYGLVDPGPYDDSWGGPTLAGAWLAHFGVSLPCAAAALWLLWALAGLHRRQVAGLRGERRGWWVTPLVLAAGVLGALFLRAFLHQA